MRTMSEMLKDLGFEDTVPPEPISVAGVKGPIFTKVMEFCKMHLEHPVPKLDGPEKRKLELTEWEKTYCAEMDNELLFRVICAANFLDLKALLDVTLLFLAIKLKSQTPDEIRAEFNITHVFTPEEEEKAKKEFEEIILDTINRK